MIRLTRDLIRRWLDRLLPHLKIEGAGKEEAARPDLAGTPEPVRS